MADWVSVEDRLPEIKHQKDGYRISDLVLITGDIDEIEFDGPQICTAYLADNGDDGLSWEIPFIYSPFWAGDGHIKAWMPLPKPYKGVADNGKAE